MTTPTPRREYDHAPELHDKGLAFDVRTILGRRAFGVALGAGMLTLAACATGDPSPSATATPTEAPTATPTSTASATASGDLVAEPDPTSVLPGETEGPYPGDGSNGPDVLVEDGIIRRDMRASFGSATGAADGVPLDVELRIVDNAAGGAPIVGAAVYAWHCDQNGEYSMYSQAIAGENYLRAVQETDATGTARFTTIYPGCYDGRWPHIHFEVYESLQTATASGQIVAISQIALPQAASEAVYTDARYPQSAQNLSRLSLASDHVFGDDGGVNQLATITGDATNGFAAGLAVSLT